MLPAKNNSYATGFFFLFLRFAAVLSGSIVGPDKPQHLWWRHFRRVDYNVEGEVTKPQCIGGG